MADNMRTEETLMVHGSMLIRLEAAAIRNERSFAEIQATLDGLVERLDAVLNTNLANQPNPQITTDQPNNDSNTPGETEISRFNVKDVTVEEIAQVKNQQGINNQNDQDLLVGCIAQPLGFSKGRPTAACIIYKCLSHWRSFKAEKTSIFDRIIQTIDHKTEKQDDNNILAYRLSTASTLLVLTQRQHEAKMYASLFKMQLSASVEKIYRMIRDNLKKEISILLVLCMQAPRKSRENLLKGPTVALASAASQDNLIAHWQELVNNIECFLNMLKSNNVPPFLVRKLFTQIFFFINVELFKSLLLRRECCSLSNGEYVKAGLSELEQWCYKATEEYAGSAWDELKHIRQAIGFLVIHEKPKKTLDEIIYDVCAVISKMRVLMTEDSNNAVSSSSFLLDDDSSIPFCFDDLFKSMDQINIADIELPPPLRDNSGFSFLLSRA